MTDYLSVPHEFTEIIRAVALLKSPTPPKEPCLHLEEVKENVGIDRGLETTHTTDNDHRLIDQGIFTSLNTIKDHLQTMAVTSQKAEVVVVGDQVEEGVVLDNFRVLQAARIQ
jgi:hypothetical protein